MYSFIIKSFFKIVGSLLFKIKVIGLENIPKTKGVLLIPNHNSILDSFLIIAAQPRKVRFLVLEVFFTKPFLGKFLRSVKMVPLGSINNKKALFEFEKACEQRIRNGDILCIFPEGELPRGGFMVDFKKGFEKITKFTGANIIPVNIDNAIGSPMSFKIGDKKSVRFKFRPKRTRITFNIGKQMPPETKAFEVRQKIKELESNSFVHRLKSDRRLVKSIKSLKLSSEIKLKNNLPEKAIILSIYSIMQVINFKEDDKIFVAVPDTILLSDILKFYLPAIKNIKTYSCNNCNADEIIEIINKTTTKLFCTREILHKLYSNNSISNKLDLKEIFVINGYVKNKLKIENKFNTTIYECYGNSIFPIISMNTPNIKGNDLSGKKFFQKHNKQATLGRLMPGIAVKIVNPNNYNIATGENKEGKLLIKGFGIEDTINDKNKIHNNWYISDETGFIDSLGFLTITKYS